MPTAAVINGKLVFPDQVIQGTILIDQTKIQSIIPGESKPDQLNKTYPGIRLIDAQGLYVGPGFIDEHVHGYSKDEENYDILHDVKSVAAAHLKHGTTTILPSPSYSLKKEAYLDIIKSCVQEIETGNSPIAGIHLEGPYINPHMGAGRKYAWDYSDEVFEELLEAGKGHILHCTYAPEMPWAVNVEEHLRQKGIVMDIGHTESGPDEIERAVQSGLKIVTHLFDGMGNSKGIHAGDFTGDPQDCVSDIVLSIPGLYYEMICDSRYAHTTKTSQKLVHRVAGIDHIILISDATCYNRREGKPEDYPDDDLRSAADLNITPDGKLFGSRLTVADCACNFRKTTGIGIRETFLCTSTNASKALGIDHEVGTIEPGKQANLVFVTTGFKVKQVIFHGNEVQPQASVDQSTDRDIE